MRFKPQASRAPLIGSRPSTHAVPHRRDDEDRDDGPDIAGPLIGPLPLVRDCPTEIVQFSALAILTLR
jgi:hypothetical protein